MVCASTVLACLVHVCRYGCSGPEIQRQYHLANRRPQLDLQQQHFRVVARTPSGEQETVVGCSALVGLGCGQEDLALLLGRMAASNSPLACWQR
jgi:hypothetical protein